MVCSQLRQLFLDVEHLLSGLALFNLWLLSTGHDPGLLIQLRNLNLNGFNIYVGTHDVVTATGVRWDRVRPVKRMEAC